jgi:hypothetical protein
MGSLQDFPLLSHRSLRHTGHILRRLLPSLCCSTEVRAPDLPSGYRASVSACTRTGDVPPFLLLHIRSRGSHTFPRAGCSAGQCIHLWDDDADRSACLAHQSTSASFKSAAYSFGSIPESFSAPCAMSSLPDLCSVSRSRLLCQHFSDFCIGNFLLAALFGFLCRHHASQERSAILISCSCQAAEFISCLLQIVLL